METNMGKLDRTVRTVLALIVVALYLTGQIAGTLAIVLGILAIIFLATSAVSFCPIYKALGLSTKSEKKEQAAE